MMYPTGYSFQFTRTVGTKSQFGSWPTLEQFVSGVENLSHSPNCGPQRSTIELKIAPLPHRCKATGFTAALRKTSSSNATERMSGSVKKNYFRRLPEPGPSS